jgi:hypothetical protein
MVASELLNQLREPPREVSPSHSERPAWPMACIVYGLVVAVVGGAFSTSPLWYAFVPAAVVIARLLVAKRPECEPPSRRRAERAVHSNTMP